MTPRRCSTFAGCASSSRSPRACSAASPAMCARWTMSASPCRKARRSAWWARAVAARRPPRAASCARSIRPTGRCCTARATTRSSISRRCRRRNLAPLRKEIQMIFQDPFGSLNPRMTLFDNVGEPLLVNGMRSRRERMDRVAELLRLVGLRPEFMHRFPHAFSGGQRQRIGIARALATSPRLVVADEPVSALDVSVQAQVLNLLLELQSRLRLTFLFVAHDLSVVRHICDRVAVMYVGQLVELATTDAVFSRPRHPYTAALMRAVPVPDPRVSGDRCDPEGRGAEPGVSAIGLLFPSTLHVRRGAVPDGGAGVAGGDAGPLRTMSLRGGVGIGSGSRHIADHGVQLCEWGSQCRPGRPGFNVSELLSTRNLRLRSIVMAGEGRPSTSCDARATEDVDGGAKPRHDDGGDPCGFHQGGSAWPADRPGGALRHPAGIGRPDGLQAGRARSARPDRRGREDDPDRLARDHAGHRCPDDRRDARLRLVVSRRPTPGRAICRIGSIPASSS